jgi:hypothetical protein
MRREVFRATGGLPILGPEGTILFRALDRQFRRWANACGAIEKRYPLLMRVEDLAKVDYFRNFPHIVVCGCGIRGDAQESYALRSAPLSDRGTKNSESAEEIKGK